MTPEFSRIIRAHEVGPHSRPQSLTATPQERSQLAARFALIALDALEATLTARPHTDGILITGQLKAHGQQACVRSGQPVPFSLSEPIHLHLVPDAPEGEDVELAADDLDTEPLTEIIDLGEITAQAFGLALDPYPRSATPVPNILTEEQARAAASPFAILKK